MPILMDSDERPIEVDAGAATEIFRLRAEVERLREQFETARLVSKARQERLAKCCTQRGARMQIMREWLITTIKYHNQVRWEDFLYDRPEARDWFDEDGVPK